MLVDEEHVSVEAGALRGPGADVLGQVLARSHVVARDVGHQPVVPFTEFGVLAGRRVGV